MKLVCRGQLSRVSPNSAATVFLELLRKIDIVAASVGELRLAEQDSGARDAEALTPRVYENPRQVVFAVGERRGGTALAV